jgi:hypothetical protein
MARAWQNVIGDIGSGWGILLDITHSAYISLGLKPRDTTPTASGAPTAQVTVETYLVGRHEPGVKIIYAEAAGERAYSLSVVTDRTLFHGTE